MMSNIYFTNVLSYNKILSPINFLDVIFRGCIFSHVTLLVNVSVSVIFRSIYFHLLRYFWHLGSVRWTNSSWIVLWKMSRRTYIFTISETTSRFKNGTISFIFRVCGPSWAENEKLKKVSVTKYHSLSFFVCFI